MATPTDFIEIHNPDASILGSDHIEFLRKLNKPAWITLDGEDTSRQRAIVTLLHGNEPSGLKAIHRFLSSKVKPATNLGIFVVSVDAALLTPLLSHRYLPEEEDFNRCFNVPPEVTQDPKRQQKNQNQYLLAQNILNTLKAYAPEAVVDTHNTSAHSEPFAVATSSSTVMHQLTQIFTHRLVVLDLTLGTLIEQEIGCPVVTVEFGGYLDPKADQLAQASIETFLTRKQLFNLESEYLQLLQHPLRLEVTEDCELEYSSSVQVKADVTIFNTIDQLNFNTLKPGTTIGWLGKQGMSHLKLMDHNGKNIAGKIFKEENSFLITQQEITIFMATTDAYIAAHDCLMYICLDH